MKFFMTSYLERPYQKAFYLDHRYIGEFTFILLVVRAIGQNLEHFKELYNFVIKFFMSSYLYNH